MAHFGRQLANPDNLPEVGHVLNVPGIVPSEVLIAFSPD
jgi:hypothetical protein